MSLLLNSATAETAWNFDPRSIPDCAIWLDAADTATIGLNGTSVLRWDSKGYVPTSAVQSTGTVTYSSASTVNGINAIQCNATGTLSISYGLTGTGGKSFFGVGKTEVANPGFNSVAFTFLGSELQVLRGASAQNYTISGRGGNVVAGNIESPLRYANVYSIIAGSTAALNVGAVNGFSPGLVTSSLGAGAISLTTQAIGSSNAGTSTICEIIVYDRNVTPTERTAIEGYLMWKWGAMSYSTPEFTPTSISGCQLWLHSDVDISNASSNFTFSSGVNISTWKDLSGNGRDATPISGTTAPTLILDPISATVNSVGPKNVVSFSSGGLVTSLTVPTTQDVTVFVVGCLAVTTSGQTLFGLNSYNGTDGNKLLIQVSSSSTWMFSGGTAGTNGNVSTISIANNRYDIITCFWSPALRTQVNAIGAYAIPSTSAPTSLTLAQSTVGCNTSGTTASAGLNGRLAEVIVYYGTLTQDQQYQVERYLSAKWNRPLQHTAAIGHPARSIQTFGRRFNPVDVDNLIAWYDMADSGRVSGSGTITVTDKSPTTRADSIPLLTSTINATGALGNSLATVTVTTQQASNTSAVNLGFGGNTPSTVVLVGNTPAQTMDTLRSTTLNSMRLQITATNVSAQNNQVGNLITSTTLPNRTKLAIASHPGGAAAGALTLYECGRSYGNTGTYVLNQTDSRVRMGVFTTANAEFGEVMYFSKELTSQERQKIEGYLADKWNLRASLITTHPSYYGSEYLNIINFNPTSITGCRVWLDASDISTVNSGSITPGGTVTSWGDKSGINTSFSIAGTPTWNYSINRRPAINTTSGRFLGLLGVTPLTNFTSTTFIVSSLISTPTAGWPCVTYTDGVAVGTGNRFNAFDFSTTFRSSFVRAGTTFTATMTASALATPFIWVSTFNGSTSMTINRNVGATTGTGTVTAGAMSNGGFFYIGQTPALVGTNTWPGHISEIITYNSVLSASNIILVGQYLAKKWGLVPQILAANQFRIPLSLPNSPTIIPTYIPGCQLWLDGMDPTTVSLSNSAVQLWMDKSGNRRHATQTNASLRPTYSNNGIVFPDLKYLNLTNAFAMLGASTVYSIFIVERRTSNKSGNLILGFGGSNNNGITMGYNTNTEFRLSSGQTVDTNYVVAGFQNPDPVRIWAGTYNTTQRILYMNGTAVTTTAYTTAVSSWATPTIGYFSGFTNNLYYVGNVFELLVYNTALTTLQRQQIEGYLAWKWGLRSTLATFHPFKNTMP